MLSEPLPCRAAGPVPVFDRDKCRRIREQILLVFGRDSRLGDAELERRYSLTDGGILVMILGPRVSPGQSGYREIS